MPEPFVDHGCLWVSEDTVGWQGKIYGAPVVVKPDDRKTDPTSKLPDFFMYPPEDPAKDAGALWWRTAGNGTRYLTGKLKTGGSARNVSLWPVQQKSDRSPAWRVMPPRDEPKPAPSHDPEDVDLDAVSF